MLIDARATDQGSDLAVCAVQLWRIRRVLSRNSRSMSIFGFLGLGMGLGGDETVSKSCK